MPKDYGQACPVARSLAFLGERWTLLLIRDLLTGPRKFHEFSASLPGVAPTVLSQRLKVLEEHGIVSRRLYSEHPPRAEYTLTERGMELRPVVRALGIWGARHIGANWTFVHDACGSNVESAYYCPACDELVASDHVKRHPIAKRGRAPLPRRVARARRQSRASRKPAAGG